MSLRCDLQFLIQNIWVYFSYLGAITAQSDASLSFCEAKQVCVIWNSKMNWLRIYFYRMKHTNLMNMAVDLLKERIECTFCLFNGLLISRVNFLKSESVTRSKRLTELNWSVFQRYVLTLHHYLQSFLIFRLIIYSVRFSINMHDVTFRQLHDPWCIENIVKAQNEPKFQARTGLSWLNPQ